MTRRLGRGLMSTQVVADSIRYSVDAANQPVLFARTRGAPDQEMWSANAWAALVATLGLGDVACASTKAAVRAVLKAYEDQYSPSEVTLFSRKYDDDPKPLRERGVARALSYEPDWEGVAPEGQSDGTTLLVVSPLNEEESELLVMPAAFSASAERMVADLTPESGTCHVVSGALPELRRLADAQSLFDPLPLPAHVDDWLAQIREAPQSIGDLLTTGGRQVPSPHARAICVQPLVLPGRAASTSACEASLFAGIAGFLTAFFHGTEVRLMPELTVDVRPQKRHAFLLGKQCLWRDECPANGQKLPHGQICAGHLLRALTAKPARAAGKAGATDQRRAAGDQRRPPAASTNPLNDLRGAP